MQEKTHIIIKFEKYRYSGEVSNFLSITKPASIVSEAIFRAIYAFEQRYLCFLSNVFLITIKWQYDYYQIFIFNSPCCRYIT